MEAPFTAQTRATGRYAAKPLAPSVLPLLLQDRHAIRRQNHMRDFFFLQQ